MDSELLTQMNERIVKSFLDMLILKELKRGSLNDSQLANIFHKRFGEIVDFTLINSNLKFLEKEELITNGKDENRKVYTLTVRGDKKARAFLNSKNKILGLLLNLFI
jgi:DNA-binding PadR family transcriptional regulator